MTTTVIDVAAIPALGHDEAMQLAETEYQRVLDLGRSLKPADWEKATDCPGWDAKAIYGHLLGMMERFRGPEEAQRQEAVAMKRAGERGIYRIDALTGLQVEEHAHLSIDELLRAFEREIPVAMAGRGNTTEAARAAVFSPGPPFDDEWTVGYALDVILTRDPWMHRVDVSRAAGCDLMLTAEHDGRLVADAVADWGRRHGQPFTLVLGGPAGGTYVQGDAGERHELDAVEFCRIISGRAGGTGLLTTEVPF